MNNLMFLLVTALSLLANADALTASATRSGIKLPELSESGRARVTKQSLRGLETTDEAATEERAVTELAQELKVLLSKPGQKLAAMKQAKLETREAAIQKLLHDGANFVTLNQHKVTKEELFKALHITDADVPLGISALASNNYVKATGYARYLDRLDRLRRSS